MICGQLGIEACLVKNVRLLTLRLCTHSLIYMGIMLITDSVKCKIGLPTQFLNEALVLNKHRLPQ